MVMSHQKPRKRLTGTAKSSRDRLIEAGERLFAEHGCASVGIRTIAAEAGVSLAALNYHFGDKEHLLAEIFAARAAPIAAERIKVLREIEASGDVTLERVIEAFLRPAMTMDAGQFGGRTFTKLRARMHTEMEDYSREILAAAFDESSRLYLKALKNLLPNLPDVDLYWRFHFMLGTMVYTMANTGRIQSLTGGKCDPDDVGLALKHCVPFLAAGFRSLPLSKGSRRSRSKDP